MHHRGPHPTGTSRLVEFAESFLIAEVTTIRAFCRLKAAGKGWMNRFSISARLMALLATLCAIVAIVGVIGLSGLSRANEGLKTVYDDRVVPLNEIKIVADRYAVNIVDTAHKVRDGAMTAEQGVRSIQEARKDIDAQWGTYLQTRLLPEEMRLVEQFKPLRTKADEATDTLLGLVRANDQAGIAAFAAKDMYPAMDPLQDVLGQLMGIQLTQAKAEYDTAAASYRKIQTITILSVVSAVLLAALIGGTMIRQISRSLNSAVDVAATVARGDLTPEIAVSGRDEIARLMAGLASMRDNLADVVAGVRGNAQGVSSASSQIAAGNTDLSSRTEEQASALQQTAASMEELSSTVKQNAEHAQKANQLAQEAATVAGEGGKVVSEVVETMQGINDSSQKIADIIGVIDGIAFQTNILALNAAVEAARAGEQGRGFAVVATEVRTLAQRSATAAKEIKELINASAQRVEQGSALVGKAGTTMVQVVAAIRSVTDIMGEISAASTEQSQGVTQVGEAVTQMDQVTQQNAALVEEMAAAAGSLSHQARALVDAVEVFRLPGASHAVAMPSRSLLAGRA